MVYDDLSYAPITYTSDIILNCSQRTLSSGPPPFDPVCFLQLQFEAWISKLPPTMVGDLGGGSGTELRMPMDSPDGRSLTWKKWGKEIISKIINAPQSTKDCWFITGFAGDTAGYPVKKISSWGNKNK